MMITMPWMLLDKSIQMSTEKKTVHAAFFYSTISNAKVNVKIACVPAACSVYTIHVHQIQQSREKNL